MCLKWENKIRKLISSNLAAILYQIVKTLNLLKTQSDYIDCYVNEENAKHFAVKNIIVLNLKTTLSCMI